MNPSPKVITGPLHPDNKGACDWGYQGFLAYGCYGYIVVVDTKTLQIVQTAGPQKGHVTHVRWSREKYHHAFATGSTYSLILAAADTTGSILVWDMITGQVRTEFAENQSGKRILGIEWLAGHDASHDLLVVLRSPDVLEMWDAYSGIRMWKKSIGDTSRALLLDPFDIDRLVVLCDSPRLLVLSDVCPSREPSDNITYIQFTDPSPITGGKGKMSSSSSERLLLRTSKSWSKVASLASNILLNTPDQGNKRPSVSDDDSDLVTSCLQAVFSPAHRHFLLLLFPTELQMLDIDVELVIGVIRLDRSSPNFVKVIPCKSVDMMLCLHENGSASVRVRRQTEKTKKCEGAIVAMDMTYDLRCQSDALRLLRQTKVFSFVYQPLTERQACLVLSDSRVIVLDVMVTQYSRDMDSVEKISPAFSLSDMVRGHNIRSTHKEHTEGAVTLKFVTSGLVSGVISPVTMAAMAPSAANLHEAGAVVAVGSGAGTIQLVNVYSGQVDREYKLFMSPVRYLQWVDAGRIIAYTYPDPPSYGNKLVKSEVVILNIKSGSVTVLRESKGKEGPILLLRVSPSRKYFALVFQDRPMEFWKIDTKQLIREVNLHIISKPNDLSWYPYVHVTTKKVSVMDSSGEATEKDKKVVCEQLFMLAQTDSGNIVKFAVLDGYLTDKTYFTNEVIFGSQGVKSDFYLMVWKKRYAVLADRLGPLYMTDGRNKMRTKKFCENRGYAATRIQFAPGADNLRFFVLYPDALDVWNIIHEKVELEASSPSVVSAITDAVWTGPESVLLVTEDSCLHVMTIRHKRPASPTMEDGFFHVSGAVLMSIPSHMLSWKLSDIFSPAILEPRTAFLLKYSLQCNIEPFNTRLAALVPLGNRKVYKYINDKTTSTADRCYMVARLFGDEFDLDFWRLFKYQAVRGKADKIKLTSNVTKPLDLLLWFSKSVLVDQDNSHLIDLSHNDLEPQGQQEVSDMDLSWIRELEGEPFSETGLDVFLKGTEYKACELSRLALCNKRRYDYRVKQLCSSRWIQLGNVDMAVQGLMETDIENDNFRSDYLKACLTSCVQPTSTSLSMIKLAATHLIAGGHVNDGVELLCLINKRLDACKYLISNGQWTHAVWLAKTSLPERECLDIVCKFAEHLWQAANQRNKAVLLMLSLDQYVTVLRMLCELRQYDTAAMFLQACQQQGLISTSQFTDCVYLEFAKLLNMVEYQSAARHYCHLVGETGDSLLAHLLNTPAHHSQK